MPGPYRSVLVEADGGSRGNPGNASYGALLKDATTGALIAERGERIGIATNNVAEYRGLIAGLELAAEHAPDAEVEVRMDSKLVVEQMSGRWKIKHPDMKPLAMAARRLAPFGTTYTWVPRAENAHADRLANEALDGARDADGPIGPGSSTESASQSDGESDGERDADETERLRGWSRDRGATTTLVLVRHGETTYTTQKRFSGGVASSNPGLNDDGRAQVRATAEWLGPLAAGVDLVFSSPVRRTHESAEILAEHLDVPVVTEDGLAEMEFGTWDGLTFEEVGERFPDELEAWLGSLDHRPGGGESFTEVRARVLDGLDRLLAAHTGQTVLAVSHVTPIKVLTAHALDAPMSSLFRMELSPASVTVLSFFEDGTGSMRMFNARPTDT